jgi:predicted transcriptional regulator
MTTARELAERFVNAYNRIDRHLRGALDIKRTEATFVQLLYRYRDHRRGWPYVEELRTFADLRNVVVHERYAVDDYLSIPSERVVQRIEMISEALINPKRVVPDYQRAVVTLSPTNSIATALNQVRDNDFSQFPVYDGVPGTGSFLGLLTENGLTRWLSQHVDEQATILDLDDHVVAEALAAEEARDNVAFVDRGLPVDEAVGRFRSSPSLEALLITQSGEEDERLLGIITQWDVIQVQSAG